jgi:hypothetical protein
MRLRLGVLLIIASWFPFAQIVIWIAGLSGGTADTVRLSIWGVQFLIGFVGLALIGAEAAKVLKHTGWRQTPKVLWRMLREGPSR